MKKVSNLYKLSYRFLLIIVSSLFVFAGIDKILLKEQMSDVFNKFGFPKELMIIVGFTELVLAVMLQSKYFTKLASNGLIMILCFATFFHLMNYQYLTSLIPISIIFILFVTNWLGQKIKNSL